MRERLLILRDEKVCDGEFGLDRPDMLLPQQGALRRFIVANGWAGSKFGATTAATTKFAVQGPPVVSCALVPSSLITAS